KVKHASGQNYVVGGPAHAYSFECSAGRVERFTPVGADGAVWHTNHCLVNEDYSPMFRDWQKKRHEPSKAELNSKARLQSLEKRLNEKKVTRDVDLIKSALASKDSGDYPVCRP